MAVLLDTSIGELVIDLFVDETPIACNNFIKLCKMKYYNGCLLFSVLHNYLVQTGDPSGTGKGGKCVYSLIQNGKNNKDVFDDEITKRKIDRIGLVCMAHGSLENSNRSQFFITLNPLPNLDNKHVVFGKVVGDDAKLVVDKLGEVLTNNNDMPIVKCTIKDCGRVE